MVFIKFQKVYDRVLTEDLIEMFGKEGGSYGIYKSYQKYDGTEINARI